MKNLIFSLLLLTLFAACNPTKVAQRRVNRITHRHPELVKSTVEDTTIVIPAVNDSSFISLDTDVEDTVEVILDKYIDSATAKKLAKKINKIVADKVIIKDTSFVSSDGVKTTVSQKGGKLKITNSKEEKKIVVHKKINTIEVKKPSIWRKILNHFMLYFLLALIVYVGYRLLKSAVKKYL